MKIPRTWVGKKNPTNPDSKLRHENRAVKKCILSHIKELDRIQQLKEYNASTEVQEQFCRDHLQD
jgi:hypothetical protein